MREAYRPDAVAHTRAQCHQSKFDLRAAATIRGGVHPGLLDEVVWWRADDVLFWSLEPLLTAVRVAADRIGQPIDVVCRRLAEREWVALDDDGT